MRKQAEKQYGPAEFGGFSPENIKPNEDVVYYENGRWWIGVVGNKGASFDEGKSHIILNLDGDYDVELNVAPKTFKSLVGKDVKIEGVDYAVAGLHPGPEGEIEYDIINRSEPTKRQNNINHELLEKMISLGELGERLDSETTSAMEQVTEKSKEALKTLMGLRKILVDAQKELGNRELWAEFTQDEIKVITDKVGVLENQLRTNTHQVHEQILAIKAELEKAKSTRTEKDTKTDEAEKRKKAVEVIGEAITIEMKKLNDADEKLYRDGAPMVPATPTVAEVPAIMGFTEWDKKNKAWQINIKKKDYAVGHPDEEPGPQPTKKRLDGTLNDDERKNKILLERFTLLDSKSPLKTEVIKLRKEKAAASGTPVAKLRGGDFKPDSDDYKNWTAKIMADLIEEWKKPGAGKVEVAKLDVDKEIKDLKEAITALKTGLKEIDKTGELQKEIDGIEKEISELDPKRGSVGVDRILELLGKVNKLQVKKLEVKMQYDLENQKSPERIVNVPAELMRELLEGKHQEYHDLKSTVYTAILDQEPGATDLIGSPQVQTKINKFIDCLEPNHNLKERLRQYGIRDWGAFKRKWHKEMASNVENLIVARASADIRGWAAREISKIKEALDRGDMGYWERVTTAIGQPGLWEKIKGTLSTISTFDQLKQSYEYSQLSQMKLAMGLRMGTYTVILGGTAVGLGAILKLLPVPGGDMAKAGIIGGAVGGLKALLNRMMNRPAKIDPITGKVETRLIEDKLKTEQERAAKAADHKKKALIVEQLLDRSFERVDDKLNPGEKVVNGYKGRELIFASNGLARIISRASGTDELKREVSITEDGKTKKVTLTGNQVLIYEETLKSAAMDEGLTMAERTSFQFAEKLSKIQRQGKIAEANAPILVTEDTVIVGESHTKKLAKEESKDKRPLDVRLAQGFVKNFTGTGKDLSATKQALVTGGVGAAAAIGVNAAVHASDWATAGLKSTLTAGGLGLAASVGSGYEKEMGSVEADNQRMCDDLVGYLEDYKNALDISLYGNNQKLIEKNKAKYYGYIQIAESIISNKHVDKRTFEEGFFEKEENNEDINHLMKENFNLEKDIRKEKRGTNELLKILGWEKQIKDNEKEIKKLRKAVKKQDIQQPMDYLRHLRDLVAFADAHPAMKDVLEQMVRDFYRVKYREVVERVDENTKHLEDREAQNSGGVGALRLVKRYAKALPTAAIYAVGGFVAGAGVFAGRQIVMDTLGLQGSTRVDSDDRSSSGTRPEDDPEMIKRVAVKPEAAQSHPEEASVAVKTTTTTEVASAVAVPKPVLNMLVTETGHGGSHSADLERLEKMELPSGKEYSEAFKAEWKRIHESPEAFHKWYNEQIKAMGGKYLPMVDKKTGELILDSKGQPKKVLVMPFAVHSQAEHGGLVEEDAEQKGARLDVKLDKGKIVAEYEMPADGKKGKFITIGGGGRVHHLPEVKTALASPEAKATSFDSTEKPLPAPAELTTKFADQVDRGQMSGQQVENHLPAEVSEHLPPDAHITEFDPSSIADDGTISAKFNNGQWYHVRPTVTVAGTWALESGGKTVSAEIKDTTVYRPAQSASSVRNAGGTGGGANSGNYDITKSDSKPIGVKMDEPPGRPRGGRAAEAVQPKVVENAVDKRHSMEETEEIVGEKLRAGDITKLEGSVEKTSMSAQEKSMANNYVRYLQWQNKVLGSNGAGLERLVKDEGIANPDEIHTRKWLDKLKTDWTQRTVNSVRAMQLGLKGNLPLSELQNSLERAGMVGIDKVPDDITLENNSRNFNAFRGETINRLKEGFEPIQDQINRDFVSPKPNTQTKN